MKNFFKGKVATAIILIATFILAGVAIFTAIRLYQLRNQSVSPNAPSSQPKAADACNDSCGVGFYCQVTSNGGTAENPQVTATCAPEQVKLTTNSCTLSFTVLAATTSPTATASASPTATATATATASPTPTPTPVPQCNNTCTSNSQCPSNLFCSIASGATSGNCRNSSCTSSTSCVCATATPKATATPGAPALPQSGTDWPTVTGFTLGIFVIIGSLLLAL